MSNINNRHLICVRYMYLNNRVTSIAMCPIVYHHIIMLDKKVKHLTWHVYDNQDNIITTEFKFATNHAISLVNYQLSFLFIFYLLDTSETLIYISLLKYSRA